MKTIDEEHRQAIAEWLEANGVAPDDVPLDAAAGVTDGRLTVEVYRRNAEGRLYVDPDTGEVARTTVTVPVKARPSHHAHLWLTDGHEGQTA